MPLVSSSCASHDSTVACGVDLGQQRRIELRGRELLGDGLAPHPHLLGGQARLVQRRTRRLEALPDLGVARLALAQHGVELVAGDLRGAHLVLDAGPNLQRRFDVLLQSRQRRFAGRQLRSQVVAPQFQSLQLLLDARQRGTQGDMRGPSRLHLHGQFARGLLDRLGRRPGGALRLAQPLALLFQRHALRLQGCQRIDGQLHPPARGAQIRLCALELGAHVGDGGLELAEAPGGVRSTGAGGLERRAPVEVFAMQTIHLDLNALAPVLVLAHAFAGDFQPVLRFLDLLCELAHPLADVPEGFLALDHTRVRILVARDAQPIRTQPDPVARDHRLPRGEPMAARQCLA